MRPLDAAAVVALARQLLGEPNRALSTTRELRWGRRGSLALVPERGVWCDHEAAVGGGMLDLVVHAGAARDRVEAARLLREYGGVPEREAQVEAQARREAERQERARRQGVAAALWQASDPFPGTAAETYLRSVRSVAGPFGAELRFHSTAPLSPYRPDARTCPAMVARIVDAESRTVGAHLTFLAADGSGKAVLPRLPKARLCVGTVKGGSVTLRLGEAGAMLGEGLESTLSAADALDAPELAVVASLSAGNMPNLHFRPSWRTLVIAPDRDTSGTGERAARELAKRAWAAGLKVKLWLPPEGCGDWNDAARRAEVAR